MAIRKKRSTEQQIIVDECEDAEEYYYATLDAKKKNEQWVADIPADITTERARDGKCLYCGNPNMDDSMSGSECRKCGIKRLTELYGYTKEDALKEYNKRQDDKERGLKFAEMLANKRLNKDIIHEDNDLPF